MTSTCTPSVKGFRLLLILLPGFFACLPVKLFAQCNNWTTTAQLITASTCAANGSFSVSVSGPDAGNLTNLQYAIPLAPNGFSVAPNNASTFNNIPPGTYTVSTLATCGGNVVGRNTTITIPGNYTPPIMTANLARPTLSCGAYGRINVSISAGRQPYTINITNAPSAYSGPVSFTTSTGALVITSLAAGNYTVQVVDACGTGTNPQTVAVSDLQLSAIPLVYNDVYAINCNSLGIAKPTIDNNIGNWYGYAGDTLFKVSAQLSNSLAPATPLENMYGSPFLVNLSPGHTLKDCYGQTVTYTIHPPCGADIQATQSIPYPFVTFINDQNCNAGFKTNIAFHGMVCFPITYSFQNSVTGTNYGPFTINGLSDVTPSLPLGPYALQYTTGDGYTGNANFGAWPVTGNPYSVTVSNGSPGLTNYINGFVFSTSSNASLSRQVELFSGPAGYSCNGVWTGNLDLSVTQNQTPGPGTLKFPAGNYVWKITDNCGSYYLPITVGPVSLYQFTTGIDHQKQTCEGLWIWPKGTAATNGQNAPIHFSILKNGHPMLTPVTYIWPQYNPGDSILINSPGTYTIVPSSSYYTIFLNGNPYPGGYPNEYTTTYQFTYNIYPVQADINHTQGFLCKGGLPGQAQIYTQGQGGIPFASPTHYNYALAHQGQGLSGPYIATNATGVFTGFGGNAGDVFDVKITDSCGAFVVQAIKILDLQIARLIATDHYVACMNNNVQLHAIYLPGATYSWTGPNGFSSSQQDPVINNITQQNIGVYYVTITTPGCPQSVTDSTIITVNGNPPKPLVSVSCGPPAFLTVINPSPGLTYLWNIGIDIFSSYFSITEPSDTLNIKYILGFGAESYTAIAFDSVTGCRSYSDSIYFADDPNAQLQATIYSPHLQVCAGDTTILVAQGAAAALQYQWFYNGAAIPGATNVTYITSIAGSYKVFIKTGPCSSDTSDAVTISVVPLPQATLATATPDICAGETALLEANTGAGLSYSWLLNNSSIPGETAATLNTTQSGAYKVIVSNGGCIAISSPVNINVHTAPVANISPAANQNICPGDTAYFNVAYNPSFQYQWQVNGVSTGYTGASYAATVPGLYSVIVSGAYCPSDTSQAVAVNYLPAHVNLGNDTIICQPGSFLIPLSVDTGFAQVLWSTGATTSNIIITVPGTYWVRAQNSCGTVSDTIHILTPDSYYPHLPSDTVICNSIHSADFSVPAILQHIQWSTGATSPAITITQPGTYWVHGESPCGILTDTMHVTFCTPEVEAVVLSKDTLCEGDCISFSPVVHNYPQQYQWTFPGGNPATSNVSAPATVCYAHAGTYPFTLIVSNSNGADTFSGEVVVYETPHGRFDDTTITVPYKTDVTMPPCADGLTTDWYKDNELVCAGCTQLQVEARYFQSVYHCVVRNGDCTDSCVYKLQVIDIPHDLWLPDAFSPNGDGRNDVFHIITDNPNVLVINLSVFDRWGQRVFTSNMNNDGWDGTVHGAPAELGTYYWMIRYKILGSETVYSKKGDVTVVR